MLLVDQWRLTALTTGTLVVVMSFAAAVKPLADGALDAGLALRFMGLALVPMLQFALPFASGFGATLVYHRFAAENEALAAYAGGAAHRALLAPAVASGVALALVVGALTQFVIPGYLRGMQSLVAQDIGRLITTAIESGRPLRLPGGLVVHADAVRRPPGPIAGGAKDHLALIGVVALRVGRDGEVESEATAQRAGVWLYGPGEAGAGWVVVRLVEASGAVEGQAVGQTRDTEFRFAVPDAFRDDPKFHSITGLERLRREPELISTVDQRRRALAALFDASERERRLRSAAESDGRVSFTDLDGQTLVVRASGLAREGDRWRLTPTREGRPIELSWRLTGDRARLQSAARAWLQVGAVDAGALGSGTPGAVTLELEDVSTTEAAAEVGAATVRTKQTIGPLRHTGEPEAPDAPVPGAAALLDRAAREGAGDERIASAAAALEREIADLRREILSKEHERWAVSGATLLMALGGAAAGLRRRDGRPLLVYFWSFFPSLAAIICIAGGQSLTHRVGATGLFLLWGGVGAMGLFVLAEYALLRRR